FAGSGSVTVAANATNYVFFGSGGLKVRTTTFPDDEPFIALAIVTTNGSAVTSVTDKRVAQSDDRERDIRLIITPEFDKVTYQADASDNVGQLGMGHDSITLKNYYLWTSTRSTLQDYDILVRSLVPDGFMRWKSDGDHNP